MRLCGAVRRRKRCRLRFVSPIQPGSVRAWARVPVLPFGNSRRVMSHRIAAKITGVAGYVPPKVLTNADLERMVETNDEWIRTRTGIRERHIAEGGMASSHLATEAAKTLLAKTKTDPSEIDLISVER